MFPFLIPTSRRTPFPGGRALPEVYKHFADPFLELAAAAAVTDTLKVGTSVCLLTEHPESFGFKKAECEVRKHENTAN